MFEQDLIYEDRCLSQSVMLATEVGGGKAEYGCFGGARAYCCEPPKSAFPSVTITLCSKPKQKVPLLFENCTEN